jgi:WhiB family redox-sensing transcriptional regulator
MILAVWGPRSPTSATATPFPAPALTLRRLVMLPSDACTGSPGWMSRGACQDQDPELFFPVADTGPALQQISAAKAVCGRCGVRAMCLSYALRSAQYGIWGGTTPEERRAMRQPSGWNSASIRPAMVGAARDDSRRRGGGPHRDRP